MDFAIREAETLEVAGFHGVLIENEGDRPHPLEVDEEYLINFGKLIRAVSERTRLRVGLEILYDMIGTVRCGIESGADFIRLDVFTDDTETKWGIVRACSQEVAELRRAHPKTFPTLIADVHVKHGRNLSGRSLAESSQLAVNCGADALMVTGTITGVPPTIEDCREMRRYGGGLPILVGSGFSIDNAESIAPLCNGAVVASSVKRDDRLDLELCARLSAHVESLNTGRHD
jgi:membrane complex biogenesis BtpA family protein